MKRCISMTTLGIALVVGGSLSAWADSQEVQEMLQKMQQRIDELEGEVSRLKESPAESEEGGAGVTDLTSRVESLEGGLLGLNGFQFGGMAYGSYNYNFNSPDSGGNDLRIFDTKHNNFTMDLLQLEVSKETESGVGLHTVLDYGKTAGLIQSDWGGDLAHNFEVQQAYMTYKFGIGNGLDMQFGKFATLLGGEVIESPYNPNVSRSFMFGYAIPFTHTGFLFSYAINDMVSLTAGMVNGWDNVVDNNNGKSFLGSLGFEVGDLAWTFNAVAGPEEDDSGKSKTAVFDTVLTYAPMDNVDLLLNFDYGSASDVNSGGDDDADWTGLSGIATFGGALLNPGLEAWSLALRGEWFADNHNYRLGIDDDVPVYRRFALPDEGIADSEYGCTAERPCELDYFLVPGVEGPFNEDRNINLWEVTATLKWQMTDQLQARLEYRHDGANRKVFGDANRFKDSQDSMILEFAYLM